MKKDPSSSDQASSFHTYEQTHDTAKPESTTKQIAQDTGPSHAVSSLFAAYTSSGTASAEAAPATEPKPASSSRGLFDGFLSQEDGSGRNDDTLTDSIFYDEAAIILPKYAHMKTPFAILDDIEEIVRPKKRKSSEYGSPIIVSSNYPKFVKDSVRFSQEKGEKPSAPIPLQAYWTTFDRLDTRQKSWYFYWRGQALRGNYLETDLSYLILFTYELLNFSFNSSAAFNVSMLVRLHDYYKDRLRGAGGYLKDWIYDLLLELDEEALAHEWMSGGGSEVNSFYQTFLEKEEQLNSISITLWKPYLRKTRETEFFWGNKTKIYKVFKESLPLLKQELEQSGIRLADRWFIEVKRQEHRALFRGAVMGRTARKKEIFWNTIVYQPTEAMQDDLTNLLRLAENVTRLMIGEKRQIKVDYDQLPEGFKEKLIDHFNPIKEGKTPVSASRGRFVNVQKKSPVMAGSPIPPRDDEEPAEAKNHPNFSLDMERVERLQKESGELQSLFEQREQMEQIDQIESVHTHEPKTPEAGLAAYDFSAFFAPTRNDKQDTDRFLQALAPLEIKFLLGFTDYERPLTEANQWLKSQGALPGMFINSLNEKAMEALGDNLIDTSAELYEIYEEHEVILDKIKAGADR
ncbi:TerB N-terminal domain-containing protein [Brevibacillus dissolubilis]|uniref:TerB N-terminal domain-containing protein n=1 Tax=Brevibacillus dissolubilis TaxID=1844116 RepID=UPI00159B989F|nr:TerB N-terminal domain-containing protein [Brevibacillus dissolubilis]